MVQSRLLVLLSPLVACGGPSKPPAADGTEPPAASETADPGPGAVDTGPTDEAPVPEDCGNGVDDDGDGAVDCADADCASTPDCAPPEDCGNGLDDDLDGRVDCEDTDCEGRAECAPVEDCSNGADDDADGLVDCEDADCLEAETCRETCDDGRDNDLDGRVDCADGDCWGLDHCPRGEVWVTGGTLRHQRHVWDGTRSYTYHNSYGSTCWVYDGSVGGSQDTFTLASVRGTVRLPTQAGGLDSCAWSVAEARFSWAWAVDFRPSHTLYFESEPRTLQSRTGFAIDPDCSEVGSEVLPTSLRPAGGSVLEARWSGTRAASFYPWAVHRGYSTSWESTRASGGSTSFLDHRAFDVSGAFGEGPRVPVPPP